MPINKKELTKERIMKAMKCKNADELVTLAKTEGFDITKDEAEAYLAELADYELDKEKLKSIAGGGSCYDCFLNCGKNDDPCPAACPYTVPKI